MKGWYILTVFVREYHMVKKFLSEIMGNMKMKRKLFILILCFCCLTFFYSISIAKELLEAKHKTENVECSACHEEDPPGKAPDETSCMECHGSTSDIIALTAGKYPNVHESFHAEEAGMIDPCLNCHHVHKPSSLSCKVCHDEMDDINVP